MNTRELLAEMVPFAARVVGSVHDRDTAAVTELFHDVPDGRSDLLAVVLAAMVDDTCTTTELLGWQRDGRHHLVLNDYATSNTSRPRQKPICGEAAGYDRHLKERTPTCAPCRAAHAERRRAQRALDRQAAVLGKPRKRYGQRRRREPVEPCPRPSPSAYRRHLKEHTPTCEPCRAAHARYRAEQRARDRTTPPTEIRSAA